MPLVTLDHVSLAYGYLPLLDDASIEIEQGERICVIGRNGTGKSTLLRVVGGEVEPDEGRVWRQPALRIGRLSFVVAIAAAAILGPAALAHAPAHGVRNDLPQPYRTTRDWGPLPAGMTWPAVTAVEPAPDGSIYVVARCFNNACTGRKEPAILKYNAEGTLLRAFGEGMFNFPHGATVDRDGNLWVTDARGGANGSIPPPTS